MSSGIKITKATITDAPFVVAVFQQARSHMIYLPHLHTSEEDHQFFTKLVKEGYVFVAKEENSIVGFMEIKNGWLNHLYVLPQAQDKGVGTILLARAKELSPEGLYLWVFEQNKGAIRFYEREGFVLVEKRDKDHANNEEHLPDRRYMWQG